jgi:hypothetical protein
MESSNDSGYVKEPPLIFVLQQLRMQHAVVAEVEEKNDIKAREEDDTEDTSVVALAPHEESNFNVPQHAIEQVTDAPMGVVKAVVGEEVDECAIV